MLIGGTRVYRSTQGWNLGNYPFFSLTYNSHARLDKSCWFALQIEPQGSIPSSPSSLPRLSLKQVLSSVACWSILSSSLPWTSLVLQAILSKTHLSNAHLFMSLLCLQTFTSCLFPYEVKSNPLDTAHSAFHTLTPRPSSSFSFWGTFPFPPSGWLWASREVYSTTILSCFIIFYLNVFSLLDVFSLLARTMLDT